MKLMRRFAFISQYLHLYSMIRSNFTCVFSLISFPVATLEFTHELRDWMFICAQTVVNARNRTALSIAALDDEEASRERRPFQRPLSAPITAGEKDDARTCAGVCLEFEYRAHLKFQKISAHL